MTEPQGVPPAAARATETVANMGMDLALVEQVQRDRFESSGRYYTDMMALMAAVGEASESSAAKEAETAKVATGFKGQHDGQLAVREGPYHPSIQARA